MKVFTKLTDHFTSKSPIVLTLGFFDGMHLGHQQIFKKVADLKGKDGFSYALTFANHPQTVIKPGNPFPLITTLRHRIKLIENQGINSLFVLPFTEALREMSPDEFLLDLMEKITFTDIVVGPDATIGKDNEGNIELIKLLGKKYSFSLHHLDAHKKGKEKISSTLIRQKVIKGDFETASQLLGRPYSIIGNLTTGLQKGSKIGFPTLNFDVDGLVLPPFGVYKVLVNSKPAVANLGFAPTLQVRKSPVLEVHLLDASQINPDNIYEVEFNKFIREEIRFHSVDELKAQIQSDIQYATQN